MTDEIKILGLYDLKSLHKDMGTLAIKRQALEEAFKNFLWEKSPNWEDRQKTEQIFERLISNIGTDPVKVFNGFYYADKKDMVKSGFDSESLLYASWIKGALGNEAFKNFMDDFLGSFFETDEGKAVLSDYNQLKKDFGFVGKKSDSLESKKLVVGDFISKVFSDTDVYLDVKCNKTIFKTIEMSFYEMGFRQTRSTHGNIVIRFI